MTFFHNDSVLKITDEYEEGLHIIYRLFDNGNDEREEYSVLVSVFSNGEVNDFYIPNFSDDKTKALNFLKKIKQNKVLPSEIEEIFSDGISESP